MNRSAIRQRGSVLVYILIAVALFAALAMVVSNMMRGNTDIGEEKSGIEAAEVLNYARNLREAVQALKISSNCQDEQISFERSPFDGSDTDFINPNAPTDFSCHVFHPQGGGLAYQDGIDGKAWRFTAGFGVSGVGAANPDLVAVLPVGISMCKDVNHKAGVSNTLVEAKTGVNDGANGGVLAGFKGSYSSTVQIDAAEYEGKMTGCYLSSDAGEEDFTLYQVLIAR